MSQSDVDLQAQVHALFRKQEQEAAFERHEARAKARHAASPEGIREADAEALAVEEARAADLAVGKRTLLRRGDSQESVDGLSPEEVEHHSGMKFHARLATTEDVDKKTEALLSTGEFSEMPDEARLAWARALNVSSVEILDRAAAEYDSSHRPTFGKPGDLVKPLLNSEGGDDDE